MIPFPQDVLLLPRLGFKQFSLNLGRPSCPSFGPWDEDFHGLFTSCSCSLALSGPGKMLLYSLRLSEVMLWHDRRSLASLGAHLQEARYSLCKGIGSTFTQNVVGSVHVGTDDPPVFCAVQAGSRPNPFPAKSVLCLIIGLVCWDRIKIKKARFGVKLSSCTSTWMPTRDAL